MIKKHIGHKVLLATGLGALSLTIAGSAIASFNAKQETKEVNQEKIITDRNHATLPDAKAGIGRPQQIFGIQSNHAIRLEYPVDGNAPLISGKGGILGQASIDGQDYVTFFNVSNGGKVQWKVQTWGLVSAYYIASTDTFYIFHKTQYEYYSVYAIDGTNGTIKSLQSIWVYKNDNHRWWTMVQFEGKPDEFIITPRHVMSNHDRNLGTYLVTNSNGSIHIQAQPVKHRNSKERWYWLGLKPAYVDISGFRNRRVLAVVMANEKRKIYVRIFDELREGDGKLTWNTDYTMPSFNLNDQIIVDKMLGANTMYCQINSSNKQVLFKYILPTEQSKAFAFYIDLPTSQIWKWDVVNLDDSTSPGISDIDFNNNMQWINNKLYARPSWYYAYDDKSRFGYTSIFRFDRTWGLDQNDFDPDSSWSVIEYSTPIFAGILDREAVGKPFPYENDKIAIANGYNLWISDNNANNGEGGWAYETYMTDNAYTFANFSNELAVKYAADGGRKLKEAARQNNVFKNRIGLHHGYGEPNVTLNINNNYDHFYEGKIEASVSVSGYKEGNHYIPLTFDTPFVFDGFHKYETKLTAYEQTVSDPTFRDQNPAEVTSDALLEYVRTHIHEIYHDLPLDLQPSEIKIDNINPNIKTGKLWFAIILDRWVDAKHKVQKDTPKSWVLAFTGMRQLQPTDFVGNTSISVEDENSLSRLVATEAQEAEIKKYIFNHLDKFLTGYIPQGFSLKDFDITITNRSNVDGIVKIKINLKKYWDENGNFVNHGNKESHEFSLTDFRTKGITTVSTDYLVYDEQRNLFPSDIKDNDERAKPGLLKHLKRYLNGAPTDKDFANMSNDDFRFSVVRDSVDNTTGTFKVRIYLQNGYGWRDGNLDWDYRLEEDFEVIGYKTRLATKLRSGASISAGQFANKPNKEFTLAQAQTLISTGDNLQRLFVNTSLPANTTATVTSVRPVSEFYAEMKFYLSEYYDEKGISVTNDRNKIYTVSVTDFPTRYTNLKKNYIELDNVGHLYAVETQVNEQFIKNELLKLMNADRSIFVNVPNNFVFDNNSLIITQNSLTNYWSRQSSDNLSEVKIRFKLSGNGLDNEDGSNTTPEFEITLAGFKDDPNTTVINKNKIDVVDKTLTNNIASHITTAHYPLIINEILSNNAFDNIQPNAPAITAKDIVINRISDVNNPEGLLKVHFTLKNTVAWQNGKLKDINYSITIGGLKKLTGVINAVTLPNNVLKRYYQDIFGVSEEVFIADIFKDDATRYEYESKLKIWLNTDDNGKVNAHKIFSNYGLVYDTSVTDIKFKLSETPDAHKAKNVDIDITLNNLHTNSGNKIASQTFSFKANTNNTVFFLETPNFRLDDKIRYNIRDYIDEVNASLRFDEDKVKKAIAQLVIEELKRVSTIRRIPQVLVDQLHSQNDTINQAIREQIMVDQFNEKTISYVKVHLNKVNHEIFTALKLNSLTVKASNLQASFTASAESWLPYVIAGSVVASCVILFLLIYTFTMRVKRDTAVNKF